MTGPDQTELGMAEPEIDEEPPLLVRPYVQLRQHTEQPADEVMGGPPPSDDQPEDHGRPEATPEATPARTGRARTRRRIGSALTRHSPAVHPGRRRLVSVGSGALVLLVGVTALVLVVGDRPATPAAGADTAAAPGDSRFATGAVQAAPPSPATSGTPSTGATSSSLPGRSPESAPPANPSDNAQPSGPPALDEPPAQVQQPPPPPPAGTRTGRITGMSGLCLDGGSGPHSDRIRRLSCDGGAGQTWTVAGDGSIQTGGRCLQAAGGQTTLQTCDGGSAQQWRPGSAGSLVSSASGLCLGAQVGDEGDSSSLTRMSACNQSDAQRWTLP